MFSSRIFKDASRWESAAPLSRFVTEPAACGTRPAVRLALPERDLHATREAEGAMTPKRARTIPELEPNAALAHVEHDATDVWEPR